MYASCSHTPSEQRVPVYPSAHEQVYALMPSEHVPPFSHGSLTHSLMSGKQLRVFLLIFVCLVWIGLIWHSHSPIMVKKCFLAFANIVQSFCGLTEIKLQQKWFLRQIYLKRLPNNISKIGQNRTWGNMIICISNNVCFCLYVNTWEHSDQSPKLGE